jgi:hypothetical protein
MHPVRLPRCRWNYTCWSSPNPSIPICHPSGVPVAVPCRAVPCDRTPACNGGTASADPRPTTLRSSTGLLHDLAGLGVYFDASGYRVRIISQFVKAVSDRESRVDFSIVDDDTGPHPTAGSASRSHPLVALRRRRLLRCSVRPDRPDRQSHRHLGLVQPGGRTDRVRVGLGIRHCHPESWRVVSWSLWARLIFSVFWP